MNSDKLASKYQPILEGLRARRVAESHRVPEFGPLESDRLKRYRVALVIAHGPELPDLDIPLSYLREQVSGFIGKARKLGKLVIAICQGNRVLISARMYSSGTRVTGVRDIERDMTNGRLSVWNQAVVCDVAHKMIPSRRPAGLGDFCEQIGTRLMETILVAVQD